MDDENELAEELQYPFNKPIRGVHTSYGDFPPYNGGNVRRKLDSMPKSRFGDNWILDEDRDLKCRD